MTPGRIGIALGFAGLGVLGLGHGDFALQWQPVPGWIPFRSGLAGLCALLGIAGAVGLWVRHVEARAAGGLAAYAAAWLVLLHGPLVAMEPLRTVRWLGFCEILALGAGLATLAIGLGGAGILRGERALLASRLAFALALPVFGLSHAVYADFTAAMIPDWMPDRLALAYLTGAAHAAAGLALLSGILPRLAATGEAAMMSSFVLLVHLPRVAAAPSDRSEWTALCVATLLSGAAWAVAGALSDRAWIGLPRRRLAEAAP